MVMVATFGLMDVNTLEIGIKEKEVDMENAPIQMAENTKVSSRTI